MLRCLPREVCNYLIWIRFTRWLIHIVRCESSKNVHLLEKAILKPSPKPTSKLAWKKIVRKRTNKVVWIHTNWARFTFCVFCLCIFVVLNLDSRHVSSDVVAVRRSHFSRRVCVYSWNSSTLQNATCTSQVISLEKRCGSRFPCGFRRKMWIAP